MQTWLVIAARSAGNAAEKAESTTEPAGTEESAGRDRGPNKVMAGTTKERVGRPTGWGG